MRKPQKTTGEHIEEPMLDYAAILRSQISGSRNSLLALYRIADTVQDVKRCILTLRRNVFRRGAKVTGTDSGAANILLREKNQYGQTIADVLEEIEDDINIVDDAFLFMPFGARLPIRLDPSSTRFVVINNRLGGRFACPSCRQSSCDCGFEKLEVVLESDFGGEILDIFRDEFVHISRYSPSKLYGMSPITTVMEEILAVSGAARTLYKTFYQNKLPKGAVVVTTPDTEGFRAERREIRERLQDDPAYVPWLVLRSGQGQLGNAQSDVKFVQFGADVLDERSLKILDMLGKRISTLYGITAIEGSDTAISRLSEDLAQMRLIEDAQRAYNEKIFPFLVGRWGLDCEIRLELPAEFIEKQKIERLNQKSVIAARLYQMGFSVQASGDDITWSGSSIPGLNVVAGADVASGYMESGNISVSEKGAVRDDND